MDDGVINGSLILPPSKQGGFYGAMHGMKMIEMRHG